MSKKLTASDVQRREFERELTKVLTVVAHEFDLDTASLNEVKTHKRIMRAYNIAEMKAALWEEQRGE